MQFKTFTRLFLLLGMIGLFSTLALAQGETIEIGQATTTTTLSPIYTPKNYSFTQQLYTAEEIGTDGTITSIAFHWAFNGSKTFGIDVYMKHTESLYFETSNDRIPLSSSDKVFTGTINPSTDGWITITLDEPFEYDGSSNLVIAVHRTSGSPGFNDLDNNWNVIGTWYYTTTSRYMMLYMGDDSSQYVSLSPAYMTPSNYRPNIQLEISSSTTTCKAPKSLAPSNVTNNSATLTWTAGSGDQGNWDVYLTQTATDVPDENTTPTYQVTECTKALTGLTAQTTYYAYVRAACSATDKSRWVSTNFTTTSEAYNVGANNPYATDFETSCDWVFTNGELTNQWWWGGATNNGGSKAIYISNDNGTSNAYTNNKAVTVYASKLFSFNQGTYTFTFDWKANGESTYDYIRVALVPGDAEFTASTSLPSGLNTTSLPSGWIALDGGGKLNLKDSWQNQTVDVSVSGIYTMVFVWRDDTSTGNNPPAAIDNISINMLSCSKPTNLTDNGVGSRTATLTWTAGGSETLWDLYLSTSYTAPNAQTTPIVSNIESISYTLNDLQPATTYYAWVRSNCGGGDVSSWSNVYSFSTSCEAYAIPQLFGFEEEAIMNCFSMVSCANNTGRYNQNARTGSYCFRFYYNTNPPQYLISPELTGTESGVHVEFYYRKHSSGSEKFKVGYSTTTDATSSFTWGDEVTNATTPYQLFEMDCPSNTKYVAIQYTANDQYYLYIDDLWFSTPSTCPKPVSLTANNVTGRTTTLSWTENGTATDWVLQYATNNSFTANLVETDVSGTPSKELGGLSPETTYYARVKAVCSSTEESTWSEVTAFTTTATCAAPSGLSAAPTATSITLSWTAGITGQDAWDIRYKKSTDNEYTYIHLEDQTSTSYTITDLSPVTSYSLNVRAYCSEDDQSKWGYSTNQNSDLSVSTGCAALTLPYSYGFEDNLNTSSPYSSTYPIPSCWSAIRYQYGNYLPYTYYPYVCSTTNNSNYGPRTGGKFLLLYKTPNLTNEIVVLPEIDANIKNVQLKFWGRNGNGSSAYPEVLVGVMTDPSNASTFTQVKSVSVSTADYQEYIVDFSSYIGDGIYIAFKLNPSYSSYSYTYFSIDDIYIEEIPSCLIPTDLDHTVNGANEATLTWTAGGIETAWNVQYKKASESEWSEPIAVDETTYTLTGLTRFTEYEARVQANCDANDQSDWSNSISFVTECGIWTIDSENPLAEDFNDETFPPDCWQKVNFGEMGITNGWQRNTNPNNNLDSQGAVTSDFKYETWLFLPHMHLDGEATLSFDNLFTNGTEFVPCSIMLSTTSNMDVEDIKIDGFIEANFLPIWEADEDDLPSTKRNEAVSLGNYDDEDVYVAFRYEGINSSSQKVWWIDNVNLYVPITQTIELAQGWNWFTPIADISLEQLEQALGANGNSISSQTQFARYDEEDEEWSGDLTALVIGQMYKINVDVACSFTLIGAPMASVTINIEHGNNWFGYTGSETVTVEEALSGFTPIEGDKITSEDGSFTIYEDGEWDGSLLGFEPGHGYIYISQDTETKQITFTGNN